MNEFKPFRMCTCIKSVAKQRVDIKVLGNNSQSKFYAYVFDG